MCLDELLIIRIIRKVMILYYIVNTINGKLWEIVK